MASQTDPQQTPTPGHEHTPTEQASASGKRDLRELWRSVPNLALLAMSFVATNDELVEVIDTMGKRHSG